MHTRDPQRPPAPGPEPGPAPLIAPPAAPCRGFPSPAGAIRLFHPPDRNFIDARGRGRGGARGRAGCAERSPPGRSGAGLAAGAALPAAKVCQGKLGRAGGAAAPVPPSAAEPPRPRERPRRSAGADPSGRRRHQASWGETADPGDAPAPRPPSAGLGGRGLPLPVPPTAGETQSVPQRPRGGGSIARPCPQPPRGGRAPHPCSARCGPALGRDRAQCIGFSLAPE